MRSVLSFVVAIAVAILIGTWLAVESRAQAPDRSSIAGRWIRNTELSDPAPARPERDGERGRGGLERGGRMGRGGFGGGGFGRGSGRGDGRMGNPDEMARMRDALHDIMEPGDHLTITETDSIVAVTGADGRTTRLAPDGKKIKDDNTGIERKTRWDAGTLISEISGAGRGKITQTFSVDREKRQLRIVVEAEGGRDNQRRTRTHVYDPDAS